MAEFEVDSGERQAAQRLVEFCKRELDQLSLRGRCVFLIEIERLLKPEIAELKRIAAQRKDGSNG